MTVAEAMAAGTMPVPSAYAALLWPQEEELATLRARIKNLCMPKGDTSLRVQYEELSWSLRQVENLTVLLPRLLSDTSGHYLVLFESAAYQEKLGAELEQLLRTVDPAVRFYAADHACFADSAAVETFLSDTAPAPRSCSASTRRESSSRWRAGRGHSGAPIQPDVHLQADALPRAGGCRQPQRAGV